MTTSPPLLFLVEDRNLIQQLLDQVLTKAGYEVVVASNGTQAIAQLEAAAAQFNVVITDIDLGQGPDGWAVGYRARAFVHNMPVVYMSGDGGNDWAAKGVPNSVMIAKPFPPAQIITAVSRLLNAANPDHLVSGLP